MGARCSFSSARFTEWWHRMAEQEHKIDTYLVHHYCDGCGKGVAEYQGIQLTSNPPWFVHECSNCGIAINLKQPYPLLRYRFPGGEIVASH